MGQSPFTKWGLSQQAGASRRRSTRIDYQTPVILTGRDASGQPFREETGTLIVNLHGAKVRTSHLVLVGMLVTIESVRTGLTGKAICVNVYDPAADQTGREIALQLVQPGNIWGVENPPLDWAMVAAELGGGKLAPEPSGRTPPIPFKPASAPPASSLGPTAPETRSLTDVQLAELEQQAARWMDSALETLRVQADVTTRNALTAYEQRLAALVSEAEAHIAQRIEQAASELAATVETIRTEAMGELVQESLQDFQRRVGQMSAEQEARISQHAAMLTTQAGDRLARLASAGTTQADAIAAALEQRLESLRTDTKNLVGPKTALSSSQWNSAFEALQQRVEALSAGAETRIAQKISQALADFDSTAESVRHRLAELAAQATGGLSASTDKAFAELEAALRTFRADLDDELTARREQAVQIADQALRSRMAAILTSVVGEVQAAPAPSPVDPARKK